MPWKPKDGERYWYVSVSEREAILPKTTFVKSGLIMGLKYWTEDEYSNCFPTKLAATTAKNKILKVLRGK